MFIILKKILSLIAISAITLGGLSMFATPAHAQLTNECSFVNECTDEGYICIRYPGGALGPDPRQPCGGRVGATEIGSVKRPSFLAYFDAQAVLNGGSNTANGLIPFLSKLLNFGNIVAGIIVMFQIISAGYIYIVGAADTGSAKKVADKLYYVVLGLVIMASSYVVVGLVGLLLFGDPSYIINPTLKTVL